MIFNFNRSNVFEAFDLEGVDLSVAYDSEGNTVLNAIPSGDINATQKVQLPDIYGNGKGWTCTGLAYDPSTDTFLIGDIGKELPSSSGFASQLVRVSSDFTTVIEQIPLHTTFTSMHDVQGVTVDEDESIWFCSVSENLIRHIDSNGNSLGSFSVTNPTGISYSAIDDTLWVLTYASSSNILHVSKTGTTLETFTFNYSDTLDQCFCDSTRGLLYITAGANYTSRNNVYVFDITEHTQGIICTADSYSVEGIWIGGKKMVIVNDGYYHNATEAVNQANIYLIGQ